MSDLKPANRRVHDAATASGLSIEIITHAQSTRTAEEAAAACGCAVDQIVKSLVFQGKSSNMPILLLVSGANRVNEKAVASVIGEALKRADAQFVRDMTGYAIGGIPPLGHRTPLKTYVDQHLMSYDIVWAAAGTAESVFAVDPKRLAQVTMATAMTMT